MSKAAEQSRNFAQKSCGVITSVRYGSITFVPKVSKSKRPSVSSIADTFVVWRKFLVNGLLLFALVFLIPLTVHEMLRTQVVLEPIGMPDILTEMGYSGDVAAHRIWDEVESINELAETSKARLSLQPVSRQIEIAIPDTGVSFKSIAHVLRRFLNAYETRIAGEFVCTSNPCKRETLALRLRVFRDGHHILKLEPLGQKTEDQYFREGALKLLEFIDPYVVASFHFSKRNRPAAKSMAESIVLAGAEDRKWAYNLLGLLRAEENDEEGAIEQFKLAIDSDPKFVVAHTNIGHSLHRMGMVDGAREKFQFVLGIDPEYEFAYTGLGAVLIEEGEFDGAIEQFETALKFNPLHAPALAQWGIALLRQGDNNGAKLKLVHALKMAPNSVNIHNNLGWISYLEGNYGAAIEQYDQALEIDPNDRKVQNNRQLAMKAFVSATSGQLSDDNNEVSD